GRSAGAGALCRRRQLRPGRARPVGTVGARRGEALMRRVAAPLLLAPALGLSVLTGCAAHKPRTGTLAELRHVRPDLQDAKVDEGMDQAVQAYRRFLDQTPASAMTPEAMRRLADLQVEKQFGIHSGP